MEARPPTDVAEAFVEMAHSIVWASAATVTPDRRPRTRILHPVWKWDGTTLSGVLGTAPTPAKTADIGYSPNVSFSYWQPNHDTCRADCSVERFTDDETCAEVWNELAEAPEPVGYDPSIIPAWADGPSSPAFTAWRLTPYRIRVFPGDALTSGSGEVFSWSA